jgi:predicted nucleic acid-binding protein
MVDLVSRTKMIILIDTNVLEQIARGNRTAANALKQLLKSGRPVYIAQAAYNELVHGSPTAALRDGYRTLLKDLGITTAPRTPGSMADRVQLYQDNVQHKQRRGMPGAIDEYGGPAKEVRDKQTGKMVKVKTRPGDAFIAAEAKSLKARLWTFDQDFARRAEHKGILLAPESSITPVEGTESIRTARKLLFGLRARLRAITARLSNVKVKLGSIKIGGRGGLAVRAIRGLGVAVLFALIGGWLDRRRDEEAIDEGLERVESEINALMADPKLAADIAKSQLQLDEGEKLYVHFTVEVHFGMVRGPMHPYYKYPVEGPSVWLDRHSAMHGLQISSQKKESHRTERGDSIYLGRIEHFTRSAEVAVFTEDELDAFRELLSEYYAAKRKSGMEPANLTWAEEVREIRQEIVDAFGEHVDWFFAAEDLSGF